MLVFEIKRQLYLLTFSFALYQIHSVCPDQTRQERDIHDRDIDQVAVRPGPGPDLMKPISGHETHRQSEPAQKGQYYVGPHPRLPDQQNGKTQDTEQDAIEKCEYKGHLDHPFPGEPFTFVVPVIIGGINQCRHNGNGKWQKYGFLVIAKHG